MTFIHCARSLAAAGSNTLPCFLWFSVLSLPRQLPHGAQPVLDMIRPHNLPALDRVHIDRHQLERLAAWRHAHEFAGRRAGGLAAHRDATAWDQHLLDLPFEVGDGLV